MARLIDADKMSLLLGISERDIYAKYMLDQMETIDAVEVVRCKDCKYWDHGDCYRLELSRPDDFCNYGEVKEEIK